ncbi:unnamed protein product [Amoebophrya sp. A120]|nr:unnamed protein product [Amoebophrya sp. A120]|eukprot:GSA120T00010708001.1
MNRNVDVGRRALFFKKGNSNRLLFCPQWKKFSRRIYQQQHGLEIRYIDLRRIMNSFTTTSTTLNTFCNETGRSAMLSATNGKTTGAISETFVVYFPAIRLDHDYTFLWNRRNVSPKESKNRNKENSNSDICIHKQSI